MDQLCWIGVPSSGPHLILITPLMALFWGERHCWRLSLRTPNFSITAYIPRPDPLLPYSHTGSESCDVQILRGSSIPNNDMPSPDAVTSPGRKTRRHWRALLVCLLPAIPMLAGCFDPESIHRGCRCLRICVWYELEGLVTEMMYPH